MRAFENFLLYKKRIPVRGAILLSHDLDSVLLVKGWKKSAAWSFPRGKINKDEDDLICAIREVYEETGYDLHTSGLVPANHEVKSIHIPMREQDMKLYVFRDVPMETHFEPRTRKEISKIEWWKLSTLPGWKGKHKGQQDGDVIVNANKFYMVAPFMRELRKWTTEQKKLNTVRASNNTYLTTGGISHDDFLTEEDIGSESAQEQLKDAPSGIDTLEGATAALRTLLKMQPPTQGLQVDAIKSPLSRDSGSQLLALLQGSNLNPNHPGPFNRPPHTPLDHTYTQAPAPKTPQHHHPRPPHFSSMPPPPSFNINQQPEAFSYQLPSHVSSQPHRQNMPHLRTINQTQGQGYLEHSLPQNSYQSPHLVHPQPLPPQVQRAVFTGGPVHSPAVPQPTQYMPQHDTRTSIAVPNPQFPNIHAPMVRQVQKEPLPELNHHSLALLNAFKGRDISNGEGGASNDLPLRKFVQDGKQGQVNHLSAPQELPAELSQPLPVDLLSMFKANDSPAQPLASLPPPNSISESHKSTLLGLFKSPTTQTTFMRSAATALPTTATPSAVELSAVEPLSSSTGPSIEAVQKPKASIEIQHVHDIPELNPEANLPFRATAILARPQQPRETVRQVKNNTLPRARQNGHKHAGTSKTHTKPAPEKPFQPQILKRPQAAVVQPNDSLQTSPSPADIQGHASADRPIVSPLPSVDLSSQITAHNAKLYSLLVNLPGSKSSATSNDSISHLGDHQEELSIFGKPFAPPRVSGSDNSPLGQPTKDSRQQLLSLFATPASTTMPTPRDAIVSSPSPISTHKDGLLSLFNKAPPATVSPPHGSTTGPVSQSTEHKQALLSMFGRPPAPYEAPLRTSTVNAFSPIQPASAARSRVGSLAAEVGPSRGGQAPMSPAGKSFLLSYLENAAKGAQR